MAVSKRWSANYRPELNIELPVRRDLLAIARDPSFIEGLVHLADDCRRRHRRGVTAGLLLRHAHLTHEAM